MTITIPDSVLRQAALGGAAEFLSAVTEAVNAAVGGEITADALEQLNAEQTTLLAFDILRGEVSVGGFIQLIHNGYGTFIFLNPFAKALRQWGLKDLSKLVYKGRELFEQYAGELTQEMDDDAFMALYERFPEFDELDDTFVEHEDEYVEAVARYVDGNLAVFITVE